MTISALQQGFDDNICLEEFSIAALNKSRTHITFLIPGYQRGYRWTTRKYHANQGRQGEIEILLQDLLEFSTPVGTDSSNTKAVSWNNYCLQPIVLQKHSDNEYYVVDGQQRLTTLAIISHVLLNDEQAWKLPWDIVYTYENRKKLSQCLLKPNERSLNGRINDYFRQEALTAVRTWCEDNHGVNGRQIKPLFDGTSRDKHVLLIKYMLPPASMEQDTGEEPGHATFKRLNSSKIPLTSGELIKAMFMAPNNGLSKNEKMEIAKEWELIESTLQNVEYWNMFHVDGSGLQETQTKIELLFTIIANLTQAEMSQSVHDERLLFRKIEEKIKSTNKAESADKLRVCWSDILKVYWWIESCYSDIETYNLLGWMSLFRGNMPQTIYKVWKGPDCNCNHEAFNAELKKQINVISLINMLFEVSFPSIDSNTKKESLISIKEEMRTKDIYNSSVNHFFQNFFVLLNVQACTNGHIRFNFTDYKRIRKHGYRPSDNESAIAGWDVEHIKPRCVWSENDPMMNSICNLMLLDATTNRNSEYSKIKSETYAKKREFIIKNRLDHPGYFMLPCSQNAILKFYTTEAGCVDDWNEADGNNYFEALWELLMNYLNIPQGVQHV